MSAIIVTLSTLSHTTSYTTLRISTTQQKPHTTLRSDNPSIEKTTRDSFGQNEMARPQLQRKYPSLSDLLAPLLFPFLVTFTILYVLYLTGYGFFRLSRALFREKPTIEEIQQRIEHERQHSSTPVWVGQAGRIDDRHHTKGELVRAKPSHNIRPSLKRRWTD
jgi:hypothetical protein